MAQPSFIQDGVERVQSAVKQIDKQYKRLSKQADKRRREFERTAERRVRRIQSDLRQSPILKRVQGLREGVAKRIEEQVEQLLAALRIATQSDLSKLDRKVAQLTRKLRELERGQEAA